MRQKGLKFSVRNGLVWRNFIAEEIYAPHNTAASLGSLHSCLKRAGA
jgi:hypothetical protein